MSDTDDFEHEVEHCVNHTFEVVYRLCGQCGHPFCDDCLVFVSPKKPMFCKLCAMAAAGIRSTAAIRPIRTPKQIKAWEQAARRRLEVEAQRSTLVGGTGFGPGQPTFDATAMTAQSIAPEPGVVPAPPIGTAMPVRARRLFRAAG